MYKEGVSFAIWILETAFKPVFKFAVAQISPFEFSPREIGDSLGDPGTLLTLAAGYVTVCGMDPDCMLVFIDLANILTGIIYKFPMPIEP